MIRPLQIIAVPASGKLRTEDRIGWTRSCAWIVDGSSALADDIATAQALTQTFLRDLDSALRDGARTYSEARLILAHTTAAVAPTVRHLPADVRPSAAVSIMSQHGDRLTVAALGDIDVWVTTASGGVGVSESSTRALDRLAAEAIHRRVTAGERWSDAYASIQPLLREHRSRMNRPGGYSIVSDDPLAAEHAATASIEVEDGAQILAASDGFARAIDPFSVAPSWDAVLSIAHARGLTTLAHEIRRHELLDPECKQYPRLTPSDDMTVGLWEVATSR